MLCGHEKLVDVERREVNREGRMKTLRYCAAQNRSVETWFPLMFFSRQVRISHLNGVACRYRTPQLLHVLFKNSYILIDLPWDASGNWTWPRTLLCLARCGDLDVGCTVISERV